MKEHERKFDKQILARYIESECKRQLFLDLGHNYPNLWFRPNRDIKKPTRIYMGARNLTELGHKYEQKVYFLLKKIFKDVRYKLDIEKKVTGSNLSRLYFLDLYNDLLKDRGLIFLLEYEYENPNSFFENIFFPTGKPKPLPIDLSNQRPDILVVGNEMNNFSTGIRELLPDGTIKTLSKNEVKKRFGISVFDIKNIRDSKIGKKQFIEILYYMRTLSVYLWENHLEDKFFIRVDGNGIFPHFKNNELFQIRDIATFYENVIIIPWEESDIIFTEIIEEIKNLWKKSPQSIKDVPVNIQLSCGYCYFLEDCKNSLGKDGSTPPTEWSLKLLPYNSLSISEQLQERGFNTIGDVSSKIGSIKLGSTPEPIYSELPLLELKANALIQNDIIKPKLGHIHSYSIPKYTTISLTFAIETDPANQRVYGAGFYLFMSVSPSLSFSPIFDNWWKVWKEALDTSKTAQEVYENLQPYLYHKIPLREVEQFYNDLIKLKTIVIAPKGMQKADGSLRKQTVVIYQYATINKKENDKSETSLAKVLISKLNSILSLCNIIENYVVVTGFDAGKFFGPTTSIFYWSDRQLTNFQDMLEGSLENIIEKPKDAAAFESILSLFTPSESEPTHPYQHKKLFNLRLFAETVFGFPNNIISTTWHEIAKEVLKTNSGLKFWIPHFNYMDFNAWHEFLLEKDKKRKKELEDEIIRQITHKMRTINNLRMYLQRKGGEMIPKYSRVISDIKYQEVLLPNDYHSIAFVWYFFSKYTGTMEEMEVDNYRTIYPEYSIGKLAAAEVNKLRIHKSPDDKLFCILEITGLSSNMKISEGDRVYLIPNDQRGMRSGKNMEKCKILINQMEWIQKINGYRIYTGDLNKKFFEPYVGQENNHQWYLYPSSMDAWSIKLYRENGLLNRDNMGRSWLGARLSYLWNIRSKPKLFWPEKWSFTAPSMYLYAPKLLFDLIDVKDINIVQDLKTKIEPPPDISQKKAINNSLGYHLSAIQGPPGTGKSQTIAALIDEYYIRCKEQGQASVKILITAFSYSAIRVVVDKVRKSKTLGNKPTPSSKIQMIFLRSPYQKPIEDEPNCQHIDDLERKGKTWKWNGKSRTVTPTDRLEKFLDDDFILFGNAHQLYYLNERVSEDFAFDLIIVDEASQLPMDHFMASLQFIYKHDILLIKPKAALSAGKRVLNKEHVQKLELDRSITYSPLTKVIIVGDYNQLPPVQPVKPPKNLIKILDSLFAYYVKSHYIPNRQIRVNYRSNKDIVNFTRTLGVYKTLKSHPNNASRILDGDINNVKDYWLKQILDPTKSVLTIIHDKKFEIGISALEAKMVCDITMGYFDMIAPADEEQEKLFWTEKVGVVAPHNAQGRLIIRQIYNQMTRAPKEKTHLNHAELMKLLKNTVYSVEKFQGSDRELIISSIGISDKDQLNAESEFIYDLNRFNVLTSRAKSKVILICSKKFLDYIPNEREIMIESSKIRNFAYNYCNTEGLIHVLDENKNPIELLLRYRT